jgi:hypothetical protein
MRNFRKVLKISEHWGFLSPPAPEGGAILAEAGVGHHSELVE